jgi:glycerophosphoryl diester phosphodiesterase
MFTIGHRGAAALEPENTLLSISRAAEIGVSAVEIDVRMTRDGEVVVIHDETVDRTTNGTGRVNSLNVQQIKELDAGKGEKVPTLQEVLDFTRNTITVFIELKEAGTEEGVLELIRKNDMFDSTIVISFWHRLVRSLVEREQRVNTGVLLVGCPVDTGVAAAAYAKNLVMKHTFVDKGFVAMAHKAELNVFIWNIDQIDLLGRYAEMGVDGIGSNDPRILVNHFRAQS